MEIISLFIKKKRKKKEKKIENLYCDNKIYSAGFNWVDRDRGNKVIFYFVL